MFTDQETRIAVGLSICGEDCPAVQVYPKDSEIMDSANMTHLFVFPEGFKMPLTLHRNW